MMKKLTFFLSILIIGLSAKAQYTERVTDNVMFRRNGASISRLSILIPIPQTNQYQTVHNVAYEGGVYCEVDNSDDRYARFQFNNVSDDNIMVGVRTELTHHSINVDFSQIDESISYDMTSEEYRLYTGSTAGGYVDPDNPVIRSLADNIWNSSEGIVNFAYNCYDYVAENYTFLNPNTGIHPLSQILADGGGDAGNLSSILISLLRCKGIPSRHVVAIYSNGEKHVWAEFKIEGYGWIPMDVCYHQSDPYGNYFGRYNTDAIVVGYDVGHTYSRWGSTDTFVMDILQTYFWWWWGNGGESSVEWQISGEEIDPPTVVEEFDHNEWNIYQFNGNIVIELSECTNNLSEERTISVFDLLGRPIVLPRKMQNNREVVSVPSTGVYLIKMGRTKTIKIFVLKQ